MIIPDILSIGGMFTGVTLSIIVPELHGFSSGGLGSSCIGLDRSTTWSLCRYEYDLLDRYIGRIILKKPAMGEGDMKFLAAIGAFTGWQGALFSLFGAPLLEL